MTDLRTAARILKGDVTGGGIIFAAPGHSHKDRSASLRFDAKAPGGFVIHSFAGDDPIALRDHVADQLGLEPFKPRGRRGSGSTTSRRREPPQPDRPEPDDTARIRRAAALWREGRHPRGTLVEQYLASRGLTLPDDVAGELVRFHPACPWQADDGTILRVPAMLAPLRNIHTDSITGVHRTRLTPDGRKVDRRMLGLAAGAAVKIDADDAVTMGLIVGEGVETCLAARQLGLRPVWALGSVGGIAAFPVLSGIEALTILAERNDNGTPNSASDSAVSECGQRWCEAGREVVVIEPLAGDVNTALQTGKVA
jgi:putative DNA primase/helicase